MAKHLRNPANVLATTQGQCGEGVPRLVQHPAPQTSTTERWFPDTFTKVGDIEVAAAGVRKDVGAPQLARSALRAERLLDWRKHVNVPHRANRFRLAFAETGHRSTDGYLSLAPVKIVPPQTDLLARTQTSEKRN